MLLEEKQKAFGLRDGTAVRSTCCYLEESGLVTSNHRGANNSRAHKSNSKGSNSLFCNSAGIKYIHNEHMYVKANTKYT